MALGWPSGQCWEQSEAQVWQAERFPISSLSKVQIGRLFCSYLLNSFYLGWVPAQKTLLEGYLVLPPVSPQPAGPGAPAVR